jgi:hypothetical protein
MNETKKKDYIDLKWGTLKTWHITSEKGRELLKEYYEIGSDMSAMLRVATPRQKEIICELIDLVPGDIFLAWDSKYVTKAEAKKYVMEYKPRCS